MTPAILHEIILGESGQSIGFVEIEDSDIMLIKWTLFCSVLSHRRILVWY